jgi:tRNA pseudouridine38-40 synthase
VEIKSKKIFLIFRNPGVKTVEDEMEKTFYKLNFISECNFGTLQKIDWMRASRTDKKVSAIMNVVSCKLHKLPDKDEEDMKNLINEHLPMDIKIFRLIEVGKKFSSKDSNNNREYNYIVPSFMLEPKLLLAQQVKGTSPVNFIANYNFRISPEFHEKIQEVCKIFKGTKKYHNYTKKLKFSDPSSARHIYEVSCNELLEFENFQAIKFKIIGQSFLYNQIRKMIGAIIDACRENRDAQFIENSFLSNRVDVPKAPAEGLYLHKIDYSRYNDRKQGKKNSIFITEQDEKEMENFRILLLKNIEFSEKGDRVFSNFLWKLENNPDKTF